jgi:trimethylamine--corrinoid protein Co-methyltransferase
MRANNSQFLTPQMRVLSDVQMEEIHLASLEILESVGVFLNQPEALELLHGAGAHVVAKDRVKLPSWMVEDALRSAPRRIAVANRDGQRVMFLESHKIYYGPNSDAPEYLDPYTRTRHPATLPDAAAMALVTDYCPNMDFIMEAGCITTDCTADASGPAIFKQLVTHTRKVIGVCHGGSLEATQAILDMAAIVAGGVDALRRNPFIWYYTEPISPLQHNTESISKMLLCAERGVPLVYIPMPMAGSSAPCGLAGTIAQLGAEVLSGLVIQQLKVKGASFIYGGIPSTMDMKTSIVAYGAPEMSLMSAAMTDMAHYYRLPVFTTAGCGDAKFVDQQFAAEAALSCLMAALSGGNLIHDTALMDAAQMVSPEGIVLVDEIVAMVKRIMGGVPVNDETLGLDVVREVGPGGHYLDTKHTFRHFREMWYPNFFDRVRQDVWLMGDQLSIGDKINAKTREILETHKVPPLADDVLNGLNEIESKWLGDAIETRAKKAAHT